MFISVDCSEMSGCVIAVVGRAVAVSIGPSGLAAVVTVAIAPYFCCSCSILAAYYTYEAGSKVAFTAVSTVPSTGAASVP